MGAESAIEWTDATWPVVKGCSYVSPGCANCYAVDLIHRHSRNPNPKISLPLVGLTEIRNGHPRWTGTVYLNEPHLTDPLKWKRGRMIFVPSHGDLFHADVPDEFIDKVFAVMACCQRHTFQVLTKRPERMAAYMASRSKSAQFWKDAARTFGYALEFEGISLVRFPLPNVWLGTSVERQQEADERIPHLLRTPAAVRFLSCEPLLGPMDILPYCSQYIGSPDDGERYAPLSDPGIHWIIVGGESGSNSRPMELAWARSLITQCHIAHVACFVKQMGSAPMWGRPAEPIAFKDKKGGVMEEWPSDLRVREFPPT